MNRRPAARVRCYLPPEEWGQSGRVVFTGREAHHLLNVLRVRPGTVLCCFDGVGGEATAVVAGLTKREVTLDLKKRRQIPPPPRTISLAMAIPRHGKLEEIIDQATQMGASEIIPLSTQRGVVRLGVQEAQRKLLRWRQVAVEAGKQCEVSRLPTIAPLTSWKELLDRFPEYVRVLLAAVEGPHEPLEILCKGNPQRVLVLVGPEGDFTPEEIESACRAGARKFSLGGTVLRCETAAVVSLGLLSYLLRVGQESPV